MCTPLECQAHFGQKGPQTERQSRWKAVFFVVALKRPAGATQGGGVHPHIFERLLKK